MKNKEILEEGKEALNRTLLMMNYDMKKTLTENVEVISEQTTNEKDIKDEIIRATVRTGGTNEEGLRDVIKKITNKALYDKVNTELAADKLSKRYADRTIVGILNDELGNGDLEIANEIASHLKTLGINVVVTPANVTDNAGRPIPSTTSVGKIEISGGNTTQEKSLNSLDDLKKILTSGVSSKISNIPAWKLNFSNSVVYFANNGRYYQFTPDGKTQTQKGIWKIKNGEVFKTPDSNKNNVVKQKQIPSITDKNLLSTLKFDFKYPGDNAYSYAFVPGTVAEAASTQTGTWYAKNNKTGKVFDMSKHFPKTAEKLNAQFTNTGQKATDTETPETPKTPETPETSTEPKKLTDMSSIEISIMKKQKPLDFKMAYNKLGAIEKKMVDDKTVQNESLKKSLKNNLVEMKEKKENLMVESKIIRKRFEMITENRTFNSETDGDFIVESLFTEVSYLKRQGYDSKLINEGIFGWIGSLLGGTVTEVPDVIKEYISAWLLKTVGVSADSYLGNVLVTLIGDLSFSDYDKFFSDCKFASNKVADSLINGYLRKLQEENQSTSGAGGFVISAIRNSVVTYFADTKDSIIQKLEDEIINFLCPKMSKLAGIMGDKADAIKEKIVS
jgi:hypothetical protein